MNAQSEILELEGIGLTSCRYCHIQFKDCKDQKQKQERIEQQPHEPKTLTCISDTALSQSNTRQPILSSKTDEASSPPTASSDFVKQLGLIQATKCNQDERKKR